MTSAENYRYGVRFTTDKEDIKSAQALRARCFGLDAHLDRDAFDAGCAHVLVSRADRDDLVCTFRMLDLNGAQIHNSYAAQFYDLSALAGYEGRMIEMGRFCVDPGLRDPDILRRAWGAITAYVDANDVKLLFGCASFGGTQVAPYMDAFGLLKAHHLAPKRWSPRVKAPDVFPFGARMHQKPDLKRAMAFMPPLLRSYLMMGAWVSDHAVVDHDMNSLHVFTALEVSAISAPRKRLLRALCEGV
ncbi:hypothetical protein ROLI_019130 [Roseobacter fucihabitans]|uniref:L-ornithine N(alpha)-acyltransferase n=1 Tax=Roseobacter fucihabitans TaxID=1537242 RepID=A0ABZ2BS70_9RHOB|nr:GNAT family N-acyltransferase [Roseobacter litoralis]MBC6967559.1 hypothetical protein [Roseobacter litoralis]